MAWRSRPRASVITLLWPVELVGGYLVTFRWLDTGGVGRALAFTAVLAGWTALLTIRCYLLGRQAT